MPDLPNILLITTDQQRGDCVAFDPAAPECLLTPNLDELAGSGTFFRRAYAECPSCVPARRTLFSGLAPAANGMVGMTGIAFDLPAKLPALLGQAGYQTECVGKMHLPPANQRHGFDHIRLADGTRSPGVYQDFLRANGHGYGRPGDSHGVDPNGWVGRPHHLPEQLMHSFWCVNEAMDFLTYRDPSAPFFLNVSFIDPHPPLTPPAHYYERYIHCDLPEPQIGDWAADDFPEPARGQSIRASHMRLEGHAMRTARAAYYGMINFVDDQLGRLFNYLRDFGLYNDTLIVFTSDHGEMLGDHHRFRKCFLYEASARVPLIIKPPKSWNLSPGESAAPVGLQDLMPTLLEAACVETPEHCTGKSLLPLVRGEGTPPREYLHCEHMDQYRAGDGCHSLNDGHHKYLWYAEDGREQLFCLDDDPHECRDLALTAEAEELLEPWRQRLIEVLNGRPEGFTDGYRLIPGRPYEHLVPGYENGTVLPFV